MSFGRICNAVNIFLAITIMVAVFWDYYGVAFVCGVLIIGITLLPVVVYGSPVERRQFQKRDER